MVYGETTTIGAKGSVCVDPRYGGIYLPHSCDEWVIGGVEDARAMIADLEAAITVFEAGGIIDPVWTDE